MRFNGGGHERCISPSMQRGNVAAHGWRLELVIAGCLAIPENAIASMHRRDFVSDGLIDGVLLGWHRDFCHFVEPTSTTRRLSFASVDSLDSGAACAPVHEG